MEGAAGCDDHQGTQTRPPLRGGRPRIQAPTASVARWNHDRCDDWGVAGGATRAAGGMAAARWGTGSGASGGDGGDGDGGGACSRMQPSQSSR